MARVTDSYGELVFTKDEMQNRLSNATYQKLIETIENGIALDESIADDVARAIKEWAVDNGATHFTHWFQPQRSGTAEKHDAFISYDKEGKIIETFSASQLIQSEPDASSFPSGGIRTTFEARGYTAWDPTSPVFLRDEGAERSLIIPSIYLSWTGEALDMKTPLNRSTKSLNKHVIKLQKLLGNRQAKRIKVYSGMEQEYFLIPKEIAEKRPDLMICGRTVFGAAPSKGQLMDDHYFGAIQPKVMKFMNDLDKELYRYGIPVKTKHNEVAPNQFELAPLYEEMNLAIDHNLIVMDLMRRVAHKHKFLVLHHEKPFAGLNGSGKHMNWSIGDNTGANYLEPSRSPLKNISFLMTLGALLMGVQKYSGLLSAAISDAGNEHRLGSHEAPPAILSIYLGDYLTEILEHIEGAKTFTDKEMNYINHGLEVMPKVVKDISDRNRTSPIAFTGNKFELRALGSSANGSDAAKILNLLCAYGYKVITDRLEKKKGDIKKNALLVLKDVLKETKAIRFEGNNYADEWKKEAKKRKLFVPKTTPESLKYNLNKDCIALFEEFEVLTERELKSRVEIKCEAYSNSKLIELKVALDLVRKSILPSILKQMNVTGEAFLAAKNAGVTSAALKNDIRALEFLYSSIQTKEVYLKKYIVDAEKIDDSYKQAYDIAIKGLELLQTLRDDVDTAELRVSHEFWTLPSYDDLLLSI
ncbi:glutamine synthetase type III [Candidatus Marinamargulisbacteria bacterium SCGC AG-343-D04]|nr:glutamine synthetase type III [Candidatus Marinamargulisbacteria bacterium SCGC AG-343-D04]